jgi:arylsulfatase A-like enzyme/Flp pilus assembly protein TadD
MRRVKRRRDPISRTRPPSASAAARRRSRYVATLAFLLAVSAAALAWWFLSAPAAARREAGPNVLLITIDTLRADAVGAYGNARARTPWMDRLASTGVRFAAARAHNVVTLPSHANILSGRYPFEHGTRDNAGFRFPSTHETLATLLRARGYRTGAFVSAFPLDSRFGLDRGFDLYDDSFVGTGAQPAFLIQERPGADTVARARVWLDAPDSGPTFSWVHLYEPHFPYPRGYDADVSAADAALGPLLAPILDRGDTLVVLTSDHGESLGDHGESTHGIFAYEPALLVPLVLHQSGVLPARVVRDAVRHIDILPTILDAIDVPIPGGLPGRSLLSLAAGVHEPGVPTYFEALSGHLTRGWAPLAGVVRGSRKYIRLPIPELYDLDADPAERHNLAGAEPEEVRELDGLLAANYPERPAVARIAESADTIERLRSLGYVGTRAAESPRPVGEDDDPKRLIALDTLLQDVVGRYVDGDLPGALAQCRELVRRRPSMAVSWLHLAHLERASGNLAAAIDALQKAAALAPNDDTAVSLLGAYLGEAGRVQEAVAWLEPAASREDADPQVLVAYGLTLAKLGRHEQALVPFDRVVAQDPSNGRLRVERGTAHLMAGRADRARQDFEAAIAVHPDAARAHTSLGILACDAGNVSEAGAHWRRAVALDPGEHQALLSLGLVHWRAGRRDLARAYLDFFATFAPPARYARELAQLEKIGIGAAPSSGAVGR